MIFDFMILDMGQQDNTYYMQYKIEYQNKVKKAKAEDITSFDTLVAQIHKKFPAAVQDFIIFYLDEGDQILIENQDDFQQMVQRPRKIKICVRQQNGDNAEIPSILQESITSVLSVKNSQKPQEQSFSSLGKGQEKIKQQKVQLKKAKAELKVEQPFLSSQGGTLGSQTVSSMLNPKLSIYQQPEGSMSLQEKLKSNIKIECEVKDAEKSKDIEESRQQQIIDESYSKVVQKSLTVKKNQAIHEISCRSCNANRIQGKRWVCLKCPNFSVCSQCYSSEKYKQIHKKKNHSFLTIQRPQELQLINYRYTLYRMFDSDFEEKDDRVIREWVGEEDIEKNRPQAVKQIWQAAKPFCQTVLQLFQEWERTSGRQ